MYVDAHLHPADYMDCCLSAGEPCGIFAQPVSFCCSAHDHSEYERQRVLLTEPRYQNQQILFSFGIHPQKPDVDEAEFLYSLLETKRIHAIGECGFDAFNDTYRETLPMQRTVWKIQLEWAQKFQLPVIIHCRKALPLIFEAASQLKRLPAVIFHGWGGSLQEAASFLKKGVNAYFSIGKAVLRGQKSVCAMAAHFDIHRLLTETDAPYMRLRKEPFTHPYDIIAVTALCAQLRKSGVDTVKQYDSSSAAIAGIRNGADALNTFSATIMENFYQAFGLTVR